MLCGVCETAAATWRLSSLLMFLAQQPDGELVPSVKCYHRQPGEDHFVLQKSEKRFRQICRQLCRQTLPAARQLPASPSASPPPACRQLRCQRLQSSRSPLPPLPPGLAGGP